MPENSLLTAGRNIRKVGFAAYKAAFEAAEEALLCTKPFMSCEIFESIQVLSENGIKKKRTGKGSIL
ncbi:MAG: hypothetical protein J0L99_18530 [Chitinophagales bacterium]|nr:hypothetical protein [Chitinophagales bacterium]